MKNWLSIAAPLAATVGALLIGVPLAGAQSALKPAVIYSTGGKFDKSFNEGVSAGVEKF
jgi:basic membrane protein A